MDELIKIGERLNAYMKFKKIGLNQLGKLTDTSGAQISYMIKGRKYGIDKLFIIFKVLPDLNPSWLLFGEGSMCRGENNQSKGKAEIEIDLLKKEIENLQAIKAYQEMTIEAYKRSVDVATASNKNLKELLDIYRKKTEGDNGDNIVQSA